MGIIVLAVAILPLLGVGGSQLFKAESPGCMKDTKLTPRIGDTAKGCGACTPPSPPPASSPSTWPA